MACRWVLLPPGRPGKLGSPQPEAGPRPGAALGGSGCDIGGCATGDLRR